MGADREIGHGTLAPRDVIVAGRARGDESAVAWFVLADLLACLSMAGALTGLMNEPVIGGEEG